MRDHPTLKVPSIHLNGTSKASLIKQYSDAMAALHIAISALQNAAPHTRDYYLQDTEKPGNEKTITVALREHYARVDRLQSVLNELNTIATTVDAFDRIRNEAAA